jgi:hypothetical protein
MTTFGTILSPVNSVLSLLVTEGGEHRAELGGD